MPHPTPPGMGPHCGRAPGIRAALARLRQTRPAMACDQLLTGWRWLARGHAIAGRVLVAHGAAAVRVARTIPGVSHDRRTRLLGAGWPHPSAGRPAPTGTRAGSSALDQRRCDGPQTAMRTLAGANGWWGPAEQRAVHAIALVVLLAGCGPFRIPLGFRRGGPKEPAPGYAAGYRERTTRLLAGDRVVAGLADGLLCQDGPVESG